MKLTDKAVKNAKPKDKPYKLFDGAGMYLEITPGGGKLWRLKYYYLGKEKRISLGPYPLVTLAEARTKRDEAKKQLLKDIDALIEQERHAAIEFLEQNHRDIMENFDPKITRLRKKRKIIIADGALDDLF